MLSIIVPTFGEEKYLPLLLESIRNQNFKDYEIIVADNGSRDRTVEIAKSYGCRVTGGGLPAKGKNEGARLAKGELFLFLDADTILVENSLEKIIEEFKKRDLDIAGFLLRPINGKIFPRNLLNLFYNWPVLVFERFFPHTSQILVKRNLFQKIGGFDEEIKFCEDHSFSRKAKKFGKFGLIKSRKISTSLRRFKKDGWIRTYLKYILADLYLVSIGDIKSDIFKYRFGHYDNENFKF